MEATFLKLDQEKSFLGHLGKKLDPSVEPICPSINTNKTTERQAKWVKDYMLMLLLEGGGNDF